MFKDLLRITELRGIPASGKTTYAKSLLVKSPNIVRVNRDDLRAMLRGDNYSLKDENVVKLCEQACAAVSAARGYSVVIDDTNLKRETTWHRLATQLGVKHSVYHLDVSVEEAIKRDAQRKNPVGADAIRAYANKTGKRKS